MSILTPTIRPLWTPPRSRIFRPSNWLPWLIRDPSTGGIYRDPTSGGTKRGSDDNPDCGCCYTQARYCGTGDLAPLGVKTSLAPATFVVGDRCYTVTPGDPIIAGGLDTITTVDDCNDNQCLYMQAKKCSDNTHVDLWRYRPSITSLPYAFVKSGTCYYFDSGNTTSNDPTGKTILSGETPISGCSDDQCKWIQAKRCDDHTDVDLWFPPGTALPVYFTRAATGSTRFFVNDTCNKSTTPGTPVGTYTTVSGCSTCPACTGTVSAAYYVTISGMAGQGCKSSPECGANGSAIIDTLPNGTFLVAMNDTSFSPPFCIGSLRVGFFKGYNDPGCTSGGPNFGDINLALYMAPVIGGGTSGQLVIGLGAQDIFAATWTQRNCQSPWTVSNTASGSCLLALGGSATITPA